MYVHVHSLHHRGCVTSYCQNVCCGKVLPLSQTFILRCICRSCSQADVSHIAMSDDVSSRPKLVFNLCPVSRARHQPIFPLPLVKNPSHFVLLLSLLSYSQCKGGALILSHTLQWSLTSNTVICHKSLMNHRERKWDDHMIRLSLKNLAL